MKTESGKINPWPWQHVRLVVSRSRYTFPVQALNRVVAGVKDTYATWIMPREQFEVSLIQPGEPQSLS